MAKKKSNPFSGLSTFPTLLLFPFVVVYYLGLIVYYCIKLILCVLKNKALRYIILFLALITVAPQIGTFATVAIVILLILSSLFFFAKKQTYTIAQLDAMDGQEFENACAKILRCNGFKNVVVTQRSGDFGVDITAIKKGAKYAIQCKRYSRKLGSAPIQEIVAGMRYYGCTKGAVMTNQFFTEPASELARANRIELWDRDILQKMSVGLNMFTKNNIISKQKKKHSAEPLKTYSSQKQEISTEIQDLAKKSSYEHNREDFIKYATDFINDVSGYINYFYNEIKHVGVVVEGCEILSPKEIFCQIIPGDGVRKADIERYKTELAEYIRVPYANFCLNKNAQFGVIIPLPSSLHNLLNSIQ